MNIQAFIWILEVLACLAVFGIGAFVWHLGRRDINKKKYGSAGK